jgi:hypothetical protein
MASLLSGDSSIKEASQQIARLDLILQVQAIKQQAVTLS